MTAEAQQENPIGIVDPDGRVWPFDHVFSTQMREAGCEPIFDKRTYAQKLKAQIQQDAADEKARQESAETIRDTIFQEEGVMEEREPVSVAEASDDVAVGNKGKGQGKRSSKGKNAKSQGSGQAARSALDNLVGSSGDEK